MNDHERLLHEGHLALDSGDARLAVKKLTQALEMDGSRVDVRLALAEALAEDGKLPQAIRTLEAVKNPGAEAAFALADLYFEEGRLEPAQKLYGRVLEQEPDHADAWVSLGLTWFQLENPRRAVEAYEKALALEPDSVFALTALGDARLGLGDEAGALEAYRRAVAVDPADAQAHLSLADALYDGGQLPEAEAECRRAIECDPSLAGAYLTLGNLCLDADRSDDALKAYQQFLHLEQHPASRQIREEVAAVVEGLLEG